MRPEDPAKVIAEYREVVKIMLDAELKAEELCDRLFPAGMKACSPGGKPIEITGGGWDFVWGSGEVRGWPVEAMIAENYPNEFESLKEK